MLRANFIWAHKPEHLLMKAGARINTLRQLGSLSKVLISHTAEQPFCVGAQRVSTVPPGSTCFLELAFSFIHTVLMSTPKLRTGQIWTQDRLRYVFNCSHSLMLIFQRAPRPLRCPALFSCCSATKIMRIGGGCGWNWAMACFFSSRALPSLLLNSVRKTSDLIHTSLVSIEQFLKVSLSVDSFCTYYQHATLHHGKE